MAKEYFWLSVPDEEERHFRFSRQEIIDTPYGALIAVQNDFRLIDSRDGPLSSSRTPCTVAPGYTSQMYLTHEPSVHQVIPVTPVPKEQYEELSDLLRANGFQGIITFWQDPEARP